MLKFCRAVSLNRDQIRPGKVNAEIKKQEKENSVCEWKCAFKYPFDNEGMKKTWEFLYKVGIILIRALIVFLGIGRQTGFRRIIFLWLLRSGGVNLSFHPAKLITQTENWVFSRFCAWIVESRDQKRTHIVYNTVGEHWYLCTDRYLRLCKNRVGARRGGDAGQWEGAD